MELHRLKEMQSNYDNDLFNQLYKDTQGLKRSLVYQIDSRRLGVTPDIIESWFDDKLIFVFNKYYGKVSNDVLKGFIINSLKTFKFRILRKAYHDHTIVSLDDESKLINIIPDPQETSNKETLLSLALSFMKDKLSDNAWLVFELELDTPEYILSRLKNPKTKIPAKLICEYLNLEVNGNAIAFINSLREEIQNCIEEAKGYFTDKLSLLQCIPVTH